MIPEFITKIDWELLKEQKRILLENIIAHRRTKDVAFKKEYWNLYETAKEREEALDGILHLIDALQDYAADELEIDDDIIFY